MLKYFILCLLLFASACNSNKQQANNTENNTAQNNKAKSTTNAATFTSPANGQEVKFGETIEIKYQLKSDTIKIDTAVLFVNNREVARFAGDSYKWTMNEKRVGRQSLRLSLRANGKETAKATCTIKHFPDAPKQYGYTLVRTYPHNSASFTQGLFYHDGFLFEGTGQYGESAVMKIELTTGKAVKSASLTKEYFGEGITLYNDKIYQLTWKTFKCFVYDKNTFETSATVSYNSEGWGVTTIGDLLAVSDGSSIIRFVNPSNFAEARRIEVCDNNGNVDSLNELELIDGLIWANVWTTNYIVIINPETGAVVGKIDLKGIYPKANDDNCLNGIAYDETNNRIFVTGKRWDKLFEIKISERN